MATTADLSPQEVGYWLIEPDCLERLMAMPALRPLADAVLGWLASEVTTRLDLEARSLRLRLIEAQYVGPSYPCLAVEVRKGVEIPPAAGDELETAIEREIIRLLEQTPLSAFVQEVAAERSRRAS